MKKKKSKKVLSSIHGKIEEILLLYDSSINGIDDFYKELINKLPGVRLFIWVNKKVDINKFKRNVLNDLSKLQINPKPSDFKDKEKQFFLLHNNYQFNVTDANFNRWFQDFCLVLSSGDKTGVQFLEPKKSPLRFLANRLENFYGGYFKNAKIIEWLQFDGGNVLTGDNFVLVGDNDYTVSKRKFIKFKEESGEKIESDYEDDHFHKTISEALGYDSVINIAPYSKKQGQIWNPTNWHSMDSAFRSHHIDLYISLAGKNEEGKYTILIAKPEPIDATVQPCPQEILEELDDLAEKFTNYNDSKQFTVVRNPVPIFKCGGFNVLGFYNNCLVQDSKEVGRKVWLPRYAVINEPNHNNEDFSNYDEINKKIWEDLGFKVAFIEADFVSLAARRGALHCLIKVIKRGQ